MAARKKRKASTVPVTPVVPPDVRRKSLLPKQVPLGMVGQNVSLDLQKTAMGGFTAGIGLRGATVCSIRMPYEKAKQELDKIQHRYLRLSGFSDVPDVFKPYMHDK